MQNGITNDLLKIPINRIWGFFFGRALKFMKCSCLFPLTSITRTTLCNTNCMKLSNANCHKIKILSYNIISTDHHLGFQDGGHLKSILINISVRVKDGIEWPKMIIRNHVSLFLC